MMNISKMFFGVSAVFAVLAGSVSVQASEADTSSKEAILFKIHDVTPIKNNEGEVVSCDYKATFYNRSSVNVSGAVLDLVWHDNAIADIVDQEKKEDAKTNNRNINRARSTTERITDKDVVTSLEVPAVAPSTQVEVKSSVNTDRCFLLIEDLNYKVKSCSSASNAAEGGRGGSSCSGMFIYVSPKDAQYYLEFKATSIAEQKSAEENEIDKQKKQNTETFRKAISALDAASNIMSNIK